MDPQTDVPMKKGGPSAADVASLASVGVGRPSGSVGQKEGDITADLAAMPAAPEVLSNYDGIAPEPVMEMRDVTPSIGVDIVSWWRGLKSSKTMPSRECLRASDVASVWPNLILFRRGETPGQLLPDTAFATALRANGTGNNTGLPGGPEITAMLSQWMIRVANKSLASAVPVREESGFETAAGHVTYRIDALPFGTGARADYILCQVQPR